MDVTRARKDLACVPVVVAQRQNSWHIYNATKSAALCSQVALCAGLHFGIIHSRWQAHSVATIRAATSLHCKYKQRNYTLMKATGGPFRAPALNAQVRSAQQMLCNTSQVLWMKVKKICCRQWTSNCLVKGKTASTYTACNEGDTLRKSNEGILIQRFHSRLN